MPTFGKAILGKAITGSKTNRSRSGVTTGFRKDILYWIETFNELRNTIKIDKYNWGNAVDYMDLFIYKGNTFYMDGKLSVSLHQKETNKFMYIPFCSFHQHHTIKNYV